MRFLALLFLSGCALVGARRVSTGVVATTDGTIGIAIAGELAGGWTMSSSSSSREDGEMLTLSAGGNATTRDLQLEFGQRVDYVGYSSAGELRIGARVAEILRGNGNDPQLAMELAFNLARDRGDDHLLGFELRTGPVLGASHDDVWFDGMRVYAGIVYQKVSFSRRYNPLRNMFEMKH